MASTVAAERGRCSGAIGYSTDGQSHEQERRQRREDKKKQNGKCKEEGRWAKRKKKEASFESLEKVPSASPVTT